MDSHALIKAMYGVLHDTRDEMPSQAQHELQRALGPYPNEEMVAKVEGGEEFATKAGIVTIWGQAPAEAAKWLSSWKGRLPEAVVSAFDAVLHPKTDEVPAAS